MKDSAKLVGSGSNSVPIVTEGACLDAFIEVLEAEIKKPSALATKETAVRVVSKAVNVYQGVFGGHDVGAEGTGCVTNSAKGIADGTTGLLYGKVQSGKTNATIATIALALANKFRCFIVLTSDNLLLGTQTFDRVKQSLTYQAPIVYEWTQWQNDPASFGKKIAKENRLEDTGVVFVTTKNGKHLENLLAVLKSAKAAEVPSMIIDDEADNASLDTNQAKNAKQGGGDSGRTFERIGDLRRQIPNHIYLQVTATPQGLFLQALNHACKPKFCELLPPGDNYMGGDVFFADGTPHFVEIDSSEFDSLRQPGITVGDTPEAPKGLALALATFFVGAGHRLATERANAGTLSFLAHVEVGRVQHDALKDIIDAHTSWLDRALRKKLSASDAKRAEKHLENGYTELKKSVSLAPLAVIRTELESSLRAVQAIVINSDMPSSDIKYAPGMNIFVGGNKLGRGLTIKGLMVTYYGRDAKSKTMDTVHQHARMFGYRQHLRDLSRLFTSGNIWLSFQAIHEADEGMREQIGNDPTRLDIAPVWVGAGLKATRANVLNPSAIGAIVPGRQIYPAKPIYERSANVVGITARLDRLLKPYDRDEEFYEVEIDELIKVVKALPTHEWDPEWPWDDSRVLEILGSLKMQDPPITKGRINVRRGKGGGGFDAGRRDEPPYDVQDGHWYTIAKDRYPSQPSLIIAMERGEKAKRWDGERFYVPALVLPRGKFTFMFSNR